MQRPTGLSLSRQESRTLATAHHEIAKRVNITVSATLHAAFVFWEFCQKLRWNAEIDCTRALGSWAMQPARVHSVVRASPAAFPQHVKGLGSLARSPLSNHDQAQQMFVRKPQLGEAISMIDSRENVVPPRCPQCARHDSLLPWLTQTRRTAVCFRSPLHGPKPTLTVRDDRTLHVGLTTAYQGATGLRRGPAIRGWSQSSRATTLLTPTRAFSLPSNFV